MKDVIALLNDQRSELLESLFSGFRGRCQSFDLYKFRNCVITSA